MSKLTRLFHSEAFWFGFWEMLALRPLIDPRGHRQRFEALLERSRHRATEQALREQSP